MGQHIHRAVAQAAGIAELKIFDRDYLDHQTFGEQGLQREVIHLFDLHTAEARKSMAIPMSAAAWRFLTHTLKGAANAVGADEIASLAQAWERSGAPQNETGRSDLLVVFDEAVARYFAEASDFLS